MAASNIRSNINQQEHNTVIVFYVDYNLYGDGLVSPYPAKITNILEDKFKEITCDKYEDFAYNNFIPNLKHSSPITYQKCSINVPEFYNAGFDWFSMYQEQTPDITKFQLCQLTANGGLRFVYRIEVPVESDTFICPVTNNEMPIPLFIKNPEEHQQKQHVFWSDIGVRMGGKLEQFRRIRNNQWSPYNNDISRQIISAFNENKESITIIFGVISMEIIFRYQGLPNGTGVQKIGNRLHFIKVISVTDAEYDDMCQSLIHQNDTVLTTAIGDTETCCICTEDLHGPCKVIKLACGHAIHGICIQSWVSSNGPTCPVCRIKTDQGGCDGSQQIYGGR